MGGSRLKRQRRLGICLKEGSVIAFPYLRHPRAGLSHAEWRALSPGEKLERLFRMSLDHIAEILSWGPIHEPDPVRLAVQMLGYTGSSSGFWSSRRSMALPTPATGGADYQFFGRHYQDRGELAA